MASGKRLLKRIAIESLGWILVVVGIAALVLPGPGLLGIFAGLLILSQQYEWAERRVEPIKKKALEGASDAVQTWPRIFLATLGGLLVVLILQNTQEVKVSFLWWEGTPPLAAALLIAAAGGIAVTAIAGSLRILQLRRRVKRR